MFPHRRSVTITRRCPPDVFISDGTGGHVVGPGQDYKVRVSWWRWGSHRSKRHERIL